MKPRIVNVVITGGPGAGKTTGIPRVRDHFEKLGWKVLVVDETATQIISSGLRPDGSITNVNFQWAIMQLQEAKENVLREAATKLKYEKVLILYDRGMMDSRGYMIDEEFKQVSNGIGISESPMRNHYDAVFHLVTAADGAVEFYTTENNTARRESDPKEAIANDRLSRAAWIGHNKFRVIENPKEGGFEKKMNDLVKEVAAVLGEPAPFEIERKFVIKMPDIAALMNDSELQCHEDMIVQTYLKTTDDSSVRVRARGRDGDWSYTKTVKKGHGIVRTELENVFSDKEVRDGDGVTRLYEAEAQYLDEIRKYADPDMRPVHKTRYAFLYQNQYFEIDVYPNVDNVAILEIELHEKDEEIHFPPFLDILKEVTGVSHYENATIARELPDWRP